MLSTVSITVGPRTSRTKAIPPTAAALLYDALAYLPATFNEYHPGFGDDPRKFMVRLFDKQTGNFPTGLLPRVRHVLEARGFTVHLVKTELPFETHDFPCIPEHALRDYQLEAVRRSVVFTRGVVVAPTSAGKTEMAIELIRQLKPKRTLIVVPSAALLHQTVERLRPIFPATPFYKWGDGKKPPATLPSHYIMVGIANSTGNAKAPTKIHRSFGMVIVDEAHRTPAGQFIETLKLCSQAKHVYGFTATPFRNNNDEMEMEAWIGPTVYEIDYETLIRRGDVVPPRFKTVRSLREALEATQGLKTMVFVEKTAVLDSARPHIEMFGGKAIDSTSKDRNEVLAAFTSGPLRLMAATPMFDEGLNIPDIQALIMVQACTSPTRLVQRIGRGMRKHPGKSEVLVVDIVDKNYAERVKAYSRVPAFAKRLGRRA